MFKHLDRVLATVCACAALVAVPARASTTHYFYDPLGRYIGQTTTSTQVRSNVYDASDNRQNYLLLLPTQTTSSQSICCNQLIFQGQMLTAAGGIYSLALQEDGNVVLYHGTSAIWSTGTHATTGATLLMQSDGNLVLWDAQWKALWCSNTSGNPGATVLLQPDGNLVVYASDGKTPLWASNTKGM